MRVRGNTKPGKNEKKHWDQIAMLSPALKSVVKSYNTNVGPHHTPLEMTIEQFSPFLKRPIRHGELDDFVRSFLLTFINCSVSTFESANRTAVAWYVFSRICNQQVIRLLQEPSDGCS